MKYVLYGDVVTLDAASRIIDDGAVYIDGTRITAVAARSATPPPGFEDSATVRTRGTIYPGLIDVHNHPQYNIMPMWQVDRRYHDRETWRASPAYDKILRSPMRILQATPELLPAIARFVESKSLVAGVTTTQGIPIWNQTSSRYYVGLIRAVEQTRRLDLRDANSQVNDVDPRYVDNFYTQLAASSSFLLHLSEGDDDAARRHFLAMRRSNGDWALTPSFAGIHCLGLEEADFRILADFGASVIWSPLSNMILYGKTTDMRAAFAAGLTAGTGPDWSFTGSKSAFCELKCIRVINERMELGLSDRDILAMATTNAAKILKWDHVLGSIEPGKYADLMVLDRQSRDPYFHLLSAREERITLVFVNGEPAFGTGAHMRELGIEGETVQIGASSRIIAKRAADVDPAVGAISLARATSMLRDALRNLPELQRRALEAAQAPASATDQTWRLRLPELDDVPVEMTALPSVEPIELDALTVAGDCRYFDSLSRQLNAPTGLASSLERLFR
ncbi:MAG: amidohydrolase family protein [Candidatus Velthaea sp.]